MKTIYISIFILLTMLVQVNPANATMYMINAEGTTVPTDVFSPTMVNAQVGDTIMWMWMSGVHTTESNGIPNGATTWAANLNSSNTSFMYVVTVPGTYNYTCHKSTPHGMDGMIMVSAATGISSVKSDVLSIVYPNPFTNKITIETPSAEMVNLYNNAGQKLKSVVVNRQTKIDMDLTELTTGIYFYAITKGEITSETRKLVKN
jgi:plastocyanin